MSAVNITGAVTSSGATTFEGAATLGNTLTVNAGTTTFKDSANITGAVTSSSTTTFEGAATLGSTLTVNAGTTTFEDSVNITGAVASSGTTTFEGQATLSNTLDVSGGTTTFEDSANITGAVTSSSTTTFEGAATLSSTLDVSGGTTSFEATSSVVGKTTVSDGATLNIDADSETVTMAGLDLGVGDEEGTTSTLDILSGTLELTATDSNTTSYADSTDTGFNSSIQSVIGSSFTSDSDIDGDLNISVGAVLNVSSGVTNIVDASLWTDSDCDIDGTITIEGTGTLVAAFDDFVSYDSYAATTYTPVGVEAAMSLSLTGLTSQVSLTTDTAILILDGETQYVNKVAFAELLNSDDWDSFVDSSTTINTYTFIIDEGATDSTLDDTYTFDTGSGTITITNLNLTDYYSLSQFLANTEDDGSYILSEPVITGTLVDGVTLTATNLLQGSSSAESIISSGATLTLTGVDADTALVDAGTLTNEGTLNLGVDGANYTATFEGTLTAETGSTTTILSDVTFDNANSDNTTSDIDGTLSIAEDTTLTLTSGTINIFDATVTLGDADSAIVLSGDGTLIVAYGDFIDTTGETATKTDLANSVTLADDTATLIIDGSTWEAVDSKYDTVVNSTEYNAALDNVANAYTELSRDDAHLIDFTNSGTGNIELTGYTLSDNYLSDFIADKKDGDTYYYDGDIDYNSSDATKNTLLADTELVTDALNSNGSSAAAFVIADSTASLTLTGTDTDKVLLDQGTLTNEGTLTLGDGTVDDLVFNGTLNAEEDSTTNILADISFDNVNTGNTTSDIDGDLTIAGDTTLTIASGTIDIFDATVSVGESGSAIVISGDSGTTGGTLIIAYNDFIDSFVDEGTSNITLANDNATLTIDGSTSTVVDQKSESIVDSTEYNAALDNVANAYADLSRVDDHLLGFDNDGTGTIELVGYTLSYNYLTDFIADSKDAGIYTYVGDIDYDSSVNAQNTLLADTALVTNALNSNGSSAAAFVIADSTGGTSAGSLTLTGDTNDNVL